MDDNENPTPVEEADRIIRRARWRRALAGLGIGLAVTAGYLSTQNPIFGDSSTPAVEQVEASCTQPIAGWVQVTVPDSECKPLPQKVRQCIFAVAGAAALGLVTGGSGVAAVGATIGCGASSL